jgi:hypothetical protein
MPVSRSFSIEFFVSAALGVTAAGCRDHASVAASTLAFRERGALAAALGESNRASDTTRAAWAIVHSDDFVAEGGAHLASYSLTPSFWTAQGLGADVTDYDDGVCVARRFVDAEAAYAGVSAGAVTYTSDSTTETVAAPAGGEFYETISRSGSPFWAGPGFVHVSATGGDVSAFSDKVPVAPAVSLTAPEGLFGDIMLARDANVVLNWHAARDDARVTFVVTGEAYDGFAGCTFNTSAENGVIPAGMLAVLPPGAYQYRFVSAALQPVDAAGWNVVLQAETTVANGGKPVQGALTLQ